MFFKLQNKNKLSSVATIGSVAFILGFSACTKPTSPPDVIVPAASVFRGADDTCPDGIAAFTKNLYTPILRQNCVECHDENGAGPPHSTADVNASYALIKTYVDFAQIDKSRIVSRVKSQHWLNYNPKATGTTVDLMTAALQNWFDQGEKSCPNSTTPQSSMTLVPTNLPVYPDDHFMTLTWKLDSLGSAFVGSQFSVDMQMFVAASSTTPAAYRLKQPRFASMKPGVKIGGIQLYLNQKLQVTSNAWATINAEIGGHIAAAKATGDDVFTTAPILSPRHVILLQDQPTGDSLSVAFTGLQFTTAPTCKSLATFQAKILPVIQQNSCVICHSLASQNAIGAGQFLNFAVADDVACALARERSDFVHPANSVFFLLGFTEALDHPPAINLPASFTQDWANWVKSEIAP